MDKSTKKRVLILCTGNSFRSQMAEALINNRLSDSWEACSAGTEPAGYVHLLALKVLHEIGISHLGKSKAIKDLPHKDFDLVITVCDDAAENCPLWLGQGKRVHIGFPDPAQVEGTEEERLAAFRSIRDDIEEKVLGYLFHYSNDTTIPDEEKT
jgi:arsenate reductase